MTNSVGITGFHVAVGGDKRGIGDWMRQINDAGIPTVLKSIEYGILNESSEVGRARGVDNWLVYRMAQNFSDPNSVKEIPDYHLHPQIAAENHCSLIIEHLPPEFDKTAVYVEIVNEVRMKQDENDKKNQYNGMNAVDWMGEFCYEAALFMNGKGYKICAPAVNSGEPGDEYEPMFDVVKQYIQAGWLKFMQYAADNPALCLISVHEYIWNEWKEGQTWDDWYPYLFGRFEGMVAAADLAGIPRTFKCLVSEWGFARDNAPRWEQAKPIIDLYTEWMSRWPQIVGTAAWTLQAAKHLGTIDRDVQTWIEPLINYTINERPFPSEQPQMTHELFGSTLPKDNPNMGIKTDIIDISENATSFDISFIAKDGDIIDPTMYFDGDNLPAQIMVTSRTGDVVEPPPVEPPEIIATNAFGVDVSAHQGEFNWETAVSNGVAFAIVRSSNGLGSSSTNEHGRDLQLYTNVSELTRLKIPFALYHYLRADHDIKKQAQLTVDILTELKMLGEYPQSATFANGVPLPTLFIDVEESGLTAEQIKLFYLNSVPSQGIYTRNDLWKSIMGGAENWWSELCAWTAAYGTNDGNVPDWKPITLHGFSRNTIWQFTSMGGERFGLPPHLDVNIAHPFNNSEPTSPPIEPPAATVDILPYLRAENGVSIDIDATTYTQTLNTRHFDNDTWRLVKGGNGQYEYMYHDAKWIYRREDTSQGDDRFYCHYTNGRPGAVWIDRHVEIGKTYSHQKEVTHYWNDCSIRDGLELVGVVDRIKVVAIYDFYTFSNTGKTIPDVLELLWVDGGETYFFAKGLGLVGFKDANQEAQFMTQNFGREPLPYNVPSCINDDVRYYV